MRFLKPLLLALCLLPTTARGAFTVADNYRPLQFTSSSNQTAFVITWPFESDSYIVVRTSPDGTTWTAKTLSTDFTLTGAATTSGGTLTFVSGHCDGTTNGCDSGTLVSIERDHPVSMASNLSSLDPTTVSRVFDRNAMSSQQVEDFCANRAVRLPVQDDYAGSGISTILPQLADANEGFAVCVNSTHTGFDYCANSTDDVCGASSGTDNHVVRWNGTGACALQDSAVSISDAGAILTASTVTALGNLASTAGDVTAGDDVAADDDVTAGDGIGAVHGKMVSHYGLQLYEEDLTPTEKYWIHAPSALLADLVFQLPSTAGSSNYVLKTDGSGITSWALVTSLFTSPYDISFFQYGFPTDAQLIFSHVFARAVACPDDWSGAYAKASANFTSTKAYDIQKNESSVGTMTCTSGGSTCTFVTAATTTSFAAGDRIEVVGPATADATARDLRVTIPCTR